MTFAFSHDPATGCYLTRLANGVRILSQPRTGARSTAVGVWLRNGSRHEAASEAGFAHLLEHMFFKGSAEYDRVTIARLTEIWGGLINAHTGRELTALHGLVPADNALELTQLLTSMLTRPEIDAEELANERGVVLQEIASVDDSPEDAAEERLLAAVWPDHPLGRSILGSSDNVRNCDAADLRRYHAGIVEGDRILVVAVGKADHDQLVEACESLASLPAGCSPEITAPEFTSTTSTEYYDGSQAHLLWAMPAPALTDDVYPAAVVANYIIGGGVTSRLFQDLRERRGLVYDVRSWLECYADTGLWLIHTACDPEHVEECEAVVRRTLTELATSGPTCEEIDDTLAHLHAATQLELDEFEASMERLAREVFYLGQPETIEKRMRMLKNVDGDAVKRFLEQASGATARQRWIPRD